MSDQLEIPADEETGEQERLFEAFEPPTTAAWREATVASLKGRPYEKLVTRTYEGFDVQPIYQRGDAAEIAHQYTIPGAAPYVRGARTTGYLVQPWLVAQALRDGSPAAVNAALRHDLAQGQTAVNLVVDGPTRRGLALANATDLSAALAGIDLEQTPILLQAGVEALPIASLLLATMTAQDADVAMLNGSVGSDPLGDLARGGKLPLSLAQAYDEMAALTKWAATNAPGLGTVTVDASPYQNGGANAVQELAFALATGVEYIRALAARGVTIDTAAAQMGSIFAVGGNFFMEVAKLRAARLLWSQVVAAFGGNDNAQKMAIHVRTSEANKTKIDPYVNMLRATTEAFAGAVGGVASMEVAPFDERVRPADLFARRIARNTQLVIQYEASMDRIIDPAGGSWYVEQLTDQLGKEAWALFQEIERKGGMAAALQAGFPQAEIAAVAAARAANLATRRDVLVGTNMYPNLGETPLEEHEGAMDAADASQASDEDVSAQSEALAALTAAPTDGLMTAAVNAASAGVALAEIAAAMRGEQGESITVAPIPVRRLAEPYEALREAAHNYAQHAGHAPQVFLANMGPLAQHKARADFCVGFLAVGGFECQYPAGFDSVEAAVAAASASGAGVAVICSTDDTYPEIVPVLAQGIKATNPEMVVLVAGYLRDQVEAFRAAGVDDFIHIRANCYEINALLQEKIGIDR